MNLTINFSKNELKKYINLMTGCDGQIELVIEKDNDFFRDYAKVNVKAGIGSIIANCERALLLGVYAFLRDCGCRFLRPSKGGEFIPKLNLSDINSNFVFNPINRHRGITIEGAVSLQHVLDLIDWAPKVGFNSYFIQFRSSFAFFERWYSHSSNPKIKPTTITEKDAEEFILIIKKEIKRRSMILHGVGHGWTTACLGLEVNGWSEEKCSLSNDKINLLAKINGQRKFFKDKPLNTHLCYSNAKARSLLADEVVKYAENHKEIDLLHFWLADDFNNACECEECAKKNMSDWYIMILNEIDKKLSEKKLKTKIVFLVYLELFWPPKTEKLLNEDRFILMFAPIFRKYTEKYDVEGDWKSEPLLKYDKNKMNYPQQASYYLSFLNEWKKIFKGDSFDFDYHLMWDINRDFGGETLAKVVFDDTHSLSKIGLNGLISCQIQRAFYPNGLAMYVMANALSTNKSYEEIREEYYSFAFGKNKDFAEKCYSQLEKYVPFKFFHKEMDMDKGKELILEARPIISNLINEVPKEFDNEVEKESMEILLFLLQNVYNVVDVLSAKISGASAEQIEKLKSIEKDFYNSNEDKFSTFSDGFYYNLIVDGIIDEVENKLYV